MPLIDISLVTSALKTLLETKGNEIDSTAVNVTTVPPEKVDTAALNTLNLHLYHVVEDPYWKNVPVAGSGVPSVAHEPMGLCFYYVMSAHHDSSLADWSLNQQKVFGLGLKSFHDIPVITDSTFVGSTQLMPLNLRGEDSGIQIILCPKAAEEAISFWSAEDQSTARLSAFYEVRIIMLEPEPLTRIAPPVLSVSTFVQDLGAPHLDSSEGVVHYTLPPEAGGGARQALKRPARVGLHPATATNPPENRLTLHGRGLTGVSQQLFISSPHWNGAEVPVDWSTASYNSALVTSELETTIDGGSRTIYPGLYSAWVRVVVDERIILGQFKQVTTSSNATPFTIIPVIASHTPPVGDQVTVTLEAFAPDAADLADDIELVFDGETYERTAAALTPGFFSVGPSTVTFHARQPLATGSRALRIIVRGAASQPFWVVVP